MWCQVSKNHATSLKILEYVPRSPSVEPPTKGAIVAIKLWNDPRRVRRPGIRKYPTNAPQKDEGMIIEVSKKRRIKIRPRGTGLATVAD